jgi:transposase
MIIKDYKEINDVCKLHEIIENYNFEIKILKEQIQNLTDKIYGRKTEKISLDPNIQLSLFDMPEPELPIADEPEEITIPAHKRKKRGRKPLPASLPRIEVIHDLKEEDKLCPCGCLKSRIGEEVSEQLDYIPARVQVIKNIRYKYACKNCEGTEDDGPTVSIARMPEQIIPKSIATPGLLAHILTAKFADALPFYRQEKQFSRIGIELPRATMCNWTMKILDVCGIILDMMKKSVCKSPVINIDETPLKVLKESGRSKSYMWVFKGTPRGKPVILYQYHPSRSGDVPAEFLKDYKGIVQTDGYSGYKFLENNKNITHVGCWAHARRKFIEVTKAAGKNSSPGNAGTALKYISKIYKIEKQAREQNLSPDELYIKRQSEAVPIFEEFRKWIDHTIEKVPPKSLLGKALHYTLGEWSNLIQYAEDGHVTPDNNTVENAIRPFVVGRKNWLFSDTPKGARASAAIYSLIETAKANGLEPYRYLKHLFTHLPKAMTENDFLALLPHNIEK